jgi:signal transduction histidine kinase
VLHCQRASVGIFDLEKKQVQVFAAEVKGETMVRTGKDLAEEAYGDLEILRQGSMEIIEDMSRVTSPSAVAQLLQAEGIRSSINVPLLSANGLIGALNVGWEDARAITPEEMEIAGEVAGQIAIAIELAHLLQATKRHAAELEQRVQDRTAQLEAANKELEAFSYSVSHDLRAPLRHVQGYVHMLAHEAQGQLSDKGRRLLKTIVDASKEMGVLIDDLLGFSRMARAEMCELRVSLDGLVQESMQCLGTATRGRNIIWKIPPLPSVLGDPAMLKQVLANLLGNAVKYSRPRSPAQIEIGCDGLEGERVILFVRDNGVGFDPQYVHKLFGVFQRLHRAEEFEGTGIGLANVRRIIARHGGRTWAEGALDRGATFYFTLKPSSSPNPVN